MIWRTGIPVRSAASSAAETSFGCCRARSLGNTSHHDSRSHRRMYLPIQDAWMEPALMSSAMSSRPWKRRKSRSLPNAAARTTRSTTASQTRQRSPGSGKCRTNGADSTDGSTPSENFSRSKAPSQVRLPTRRSVLSASGRGSHPSSSQSTMRLRMMSPCCDGGSYCTIVTGVPSGSSCASRTMSRLRRRMQPWLTL